MNYMRLMDAPNSSKKILVLDNNGFVGTNNGWPMAGQPAMYPEAQAKAIQVAWAFIQEFGEQRVKELAPHLYEATDSDVWAWIYGRNSRNHN